jgi:lysophospholipase L1-like esterase
MTKHYHTLLCLGDSYTIGEGVALHQSFPYQTVQLLRSQGLHVHAPEVVAKTGWTTFELAEHILHTRLNEQYDFVTLLIGVNNQYRGLSLADFTTDFDFLLKKALHFAGNDVNHVIVLSIPDWGVTPFAKDRDEATIAKEIDAFNAVCEAAAEKLNICFVNITPSTRQAKQDTSILAPDGLHYAGKEMRDWAEIVATIILEQVKPAAEHK